MSEKQYLDLLREILRDGNEQEDRTGTGTIGIFGAQIKFNLQNGFPLLTTKKVHLKSIIHELLWFLSGDTNLKYLNDNGVKIWNEWAKPDGELTNCYGKQWRRFGSNKENPQGFDQISFLINEIKNKPTSRRMILTAWNPNDMAEASLPWCHALCQFKVRKVKEVSPKYTVKLNKHPSYSDSIHSGDILPKVAYIEKNFLDCHLYQRSADMFLGVPFNIASYSLLTMMFAQVCNLEPGNFIHSFGDAHIYLNHIEQVKEQLLREPKKLPRMIINTKVKDIFSFKYDDFKLENYDPWPTIKAPISV